MSAVSGQGCVLEGVCANNTHRYSTGMCADTAGTVTVSVRIQHPGLQQASDIGTWMCYINSQPWLTEPVNIDWLGRNLQCCMRCKTYI